MIDTSIPGAAGSDTVAASPAEAITLAMARRAALAADIGRPGSSAGDVLPPASAYTPAGDSQARPGPTG